MIYLPEEINENYCYYIVDSGTVRSLHGRPVQNTSLVYTDYYINSHYISRHGNINFGMNYQNIDCISTSELTNNYWYRNDMDSICIIFSCLFFVSIFLIRWILRSFFKGWLK